MKLTSIYTIMKIFIFFISFIFLFGSQSYGNSNVPIAYIKVSQNKVKIIVLDQGVPMKGVFVKISQGNMHLGEAYTDSEGEAVILCKYLSEDNKEVEINVSKDGYQPVHIHGNLITSITDYKFNITKQGENATHSNDLNFKFEYETINAVID